MGGCRKAAKAAIGPMDSHPERIRELWGGTCASDVHIDHRAWGVPSLARPRWVEPETYLLSLDDEALRAVPTPPPPSSEASREGWEPSSEGWESDREWDRSPRSPRGAAQCTQADFWPLEVRAAVHLRGS